MICIRTIIMRIDLLKPITIYAHNDKEWFSLTINSSISKLPLPKVDGFDFADACF